MLQNNLIILISVCCAFSLQAARANIISRGDGVSVTGRLNQDGISSTVIKTQQLNSPDQNPLLPTTNNGVKNDDGHFRLFYKSNAPGRSVKHEMEHIFYKNPNFLQTPVRDPQQFQTYSDFNPIQHLFQQQQQQPLPPAYSSLVDNLNNNFQNSASLASQPNNNDRSTMFNIHYHDNYDYTPSSGNLLQLQQQQQQQQHLRQQQLFQQQQYEQARKTSLLKLMLANFVAAQAQQQQQRLYQDSLTQQQQLQQLPRNNNNNNNGVQYKIVNLKFRIEPQQGKLIGQGVVGTNNGAGGILRTQHFNLWPSELPALVRSILSHGQMAQLQQNQQTQQQPMTHHVKGSFSYGHGFLKKKRDDNSQESGSESVEKREDDVVEGTERKRRSSDDEPDERQRREDEAERGEDVGEEESEEKVNDNEFQESFKSLQRRDDEAEDGGNREERNYEAGEDAVSITERDLADEASGTGEEQNY